MREGAFLVCMLAAVLLQIGCGRRGVEMGGKLEGTWVAEGSFVDGRSFESTISVNSSGQYVCQLIVPMSKLSANRSNNLEGTFEIKQGVLVDTMTNYHGTNLAKPLISTGRLVRLDRRELVVEWEAYDKGVATNVVVILKKKVD